MKVKAVLFLWLLSLLFVRLVFAETSIKSEVDKTGITTDDTLVYKVTVTSSEKNIPVPEIPKFEDFIVASQAQSSTIVFLKGRTNTQAAYGFILLPRQAGKLKIGPAKIKVGSETFVSEQLQIDVAQGKEKSKETAPDPQTPKVTL